VVEITVAQRSNERFHRSSCSLLEGDGTSTRDTRGQSRLSRTGRLPGHPRLVIPLGITKMGSASDPSVTLEEPPKIVETKRFPLG
jgi:hypothetical protein